MKLKYSASIALALWLCVVAWVSAMIVAKPSVARAYSDSDDSVAIAQLQLGINHNRQMLAAVDALQAIGSGDPRGLAVAPGADTPAAGDPAAADGMPFAQSHRLTLILSGDNGRRAVIDGQLARTGMELADGSRVRAITRDSVLIEDPLGQRLTLRMPAPFIATGGAR